MRGRAAGAVHQAGSSIHGGRTRADTGRLQLESALWAGVRGHHLENVGGSASEDWTLCACALERASQLRREDSKLSDRPSGHSVQ